MQTHRFPIAFMIYGKQKNRFYKSVSMGGGISLFFLGWIRASLAIGFALYSVTQSATQLNGKQSLRHNAMNILQADCMEPT